MFINDYNACIEQKCEKIYSLVKGLLKKGKPVHGIGLQGHYNINFPSVEAIKKGIDRLASLGLKIQITEMDISMFGYEDRRKDLTMPSEEMLKNSQKRMLEYLNCLGAIVTLLQELRYGVSLMITHGLIHFL